MSTSSEAVKKWRRKTKERIVDSFGGKCCICGYDKCNDALALHHLDPSIKEISLGGIRANPKSWDNIVKELRKCIMVCHNCHSEIHNGLTNVPDNPKLFDESFATYKEQTGTNPCPVCGTLKPEHQITCSRVCASKRSRKVDWDSIDLIEELKTKSYCQIAKDVGCSDMAVRKRHKKIILSH